MKLSLYQRAAALRRYQDLPSRITAGWLLIIGTPDEPSLLGQVFEYATTSGDPSWCGLHFPVDKTAVFSPQQVEQLKAEALNLHLYRQEFDCVLTAQNQNKLLSLPGHPRGHEAHGTAEGRPPQRRPGDCGGRRRWRWAGGRSECHLRQRRPERVVSRSSSRPPSSTTCRYSSRATMRDFGGDVLLVDGTGGHASSLTYRLGELGYNVIPVVFSARASRDDLHANRRAEMYAKLASFSAPGRRHSASRPGAHQGAGGDRLPARHEGPVAPGTEKQGAAGYRAQPRPERQFSHEYARRSDGTGQAVADIHRAGASRSCAAAESPARKFQSDYQRLRHLRNNDRVYDPHVPLRTYDPFD